ncbi:IclR family transcriptional regulator [Salinicoccus hispanicus]|uniref:Helix-turn-helix domain-containing protein n=1 Tax=Salinicoccus hispanicus TaxID=157225 RepID=A0A6N8U220_9STAP|nr:IclR family transcriptional regulator [Salinicoccus hispanicus]MXQ51377.1 helix-turn-helix domain-containing protein [Salinicoccus hispanicus]
MSVKSAERVLDIIEYLSRIEDGVSLMSLSKEMEIPKSSMSQLLLTMVNKGYLTKSESNLYKLGHKLIIAGNKARTTNDIYSTSLPILKEKIGLTGGTIFLAIRSSTEIIYLAKVDSDNAQRTTAQPGTRKPLHSTGLGKTFLAFEAEETRDDLLNRMDYEKFTSHTITEMDTLLSELKKYKAQGYVVDDEEGEDGVYCLAAPIYNDADKIIAAVSCAGSKNRMLENKADIAAHIMEAGREISKMQGHNSM